MRNQFTRKPDFGNRVLLASAAVLAVTGAILMGLMIPLRGNGQTLAGVKADSQSGDAHLQFEVASIKHSDLALVGRFQPRTSSPGRFVSEYTTLSGLAMNAYALKQQFEIDCESPWMGTELYDVEAKVPTGATKAQIRTMLQRLLAERFGLVVHRETRQLSGYRLVVAKRGPHLNKSVAAPANTGEAAPGPPPAQKDVIVKNGISQFSESAGTGNLMTPGGTILRGRHNSMGGLTDQLVQVLQAPVVDATGLEGEYDYDLSFQNVHARRANDGVAFVPGRGAVILPADAGPSVTPEVSPEFSGRPTIWDAIKEQLGLQLEAVKSVPIEVLVLDKANRQPTEN